MRRYFQLVASFKWISSEASQLRLIYTSTKYNHFCVQRSCRIINCVGLQREE